MAREAKGLCPSHNIPVRAGLPSAPLQSLCEQSCEVIYEDFAVVGAL